MGSLPGRFANRPPAVNAWVRQGVKCLPAISDMDILLMFAKLEKLDKMASHFFLKLNKEY
jgi:hypothetical protein